MPCAPCPLSRPPAERGLAEAAVVALPRGHPLADEPRVRLGELADEPLLLFRRDLIPTLFDTAPRLCADAGVTPEVLDGADAMPLVVGPVATALEFTFLPAPIRNLRRPDVVYRALHPPAPKVVLAAAWRAADPSPLLYAFVGVMRQVTGHHRPGNGNRPPPAES